MTLAEKMSEGLVVLGVGVMVVFGVLILLWGLLELMRVVFYDMPKKRKASQAAAPFKASAPAKQEIVNAPAAAVQEEDDEELIAVITAAVAAAMDTSAHNLKIKSVRRVSNWKK